MFLFPLKNTLIETFDLCLLVSLLQVIVLVFGLCTSQFKKLPVNAVYHRMHHISLPLFVQGHLSDCIFIENICYNTCRDAAVFLFPLVIYLTVGFPIGIVSFRAFCFVLFLF